MRKSRIKKVLMYPSITIALLVMGLIFYNSINRSETVSGNFFQPDFVFNEHTAQLRGVRFNARGFLVSGSVDSTVRVWTNKGEVVQTLRHPAGVTSLDVSANGNIVTGSYDGVVRLWNDSGLLIKEFGKGETVWTVAFSRDGSMIATGGEDKVVHIWNVLTGKLVRNLHGHTLNIWSVKFSPDGSYLASAGFDASIKLWKVADGQLIKTINGHTEAVVDIAFNKSGNILASTSDDKTIKLWRMPEASLIRSMEVKEHVQAAVFSPDDKYLLTAGRDKPVIGEFLQEVLGESMVNGGVSMRLWNVADGNLLQTFNLHKNDVNDVDFSADGKWIASASEDRTVRLWRLVR